MKTDYYVYLHRTLEGSLFYVGKGRGERAYTKTSRSKKWKEVASQGFSVEIYKSGLTEKQALSLEKLMILSIPSLVNVHIAEAVKFSDYSEYFFIDKSSPSGLSRKQGVYTGTYHKGTLGYCGYKAKRKDGQQYWRVKYKNKSPQVHRIIWQLQYGDIPDGLVVDHIDGNSLNNNLNNLRLVTQEENCKNRRKSKNNSSGHHGVTIDSYSCRATWVDSDGIKKSKRFNIRKLGFEEALRQASEYRKSMDVASGYSSTHGK